MNEHLDALPPVNLPSQPEQSGQNTGVEAKPTGQTEQPRMPMAPPAAAPAPPAAPDPATAPTDDPAPAAPTLSSPAIADDVDLIEKEWVERAKQIVEQTKHDPYQQNQEMTKMKTEYLKKRYNRDIKAGGDA
jgi:hypothetical protein